MAKKRKRLKLTSPVGVAKYPHLNTPDTKFDPNGVYKTGLLLDPEENADFLAKLDQLADQALDKAKNDLIKKGKKGFADMVQRRDPYKIERDPETGEKTGKVEVNFKMKHKITSGDKSFELNPDLFDAEGKPIDASKVFIYGGSEIRVNFTPRSYYVAAQKMAGVTLMLNAVQVIELVTGGGDRDADFYDFEQTTGFTVEDETEEFDEGDDAGELDLEGADF